jgi:hypothetical protein
MKALFVKNKKCLELHEMARKFWTPSQTRAPTKFPLVLMGGLITKLHEQVGTVVIS